MKAAVVSNGKDFPDDSYGNDGSGDNDNNGDDNDRAIKLPHTATTNDNNKDANDLDEGVPRKTLVTAMIRRKTDATNTDIPEGGASNGPTRKLRQYSSLTFKASAPLRSGCY